MNEICYYVTEQFYDNTVHKLSAYNTVMKTLYV